MTILTQERIRNLNIVRNSILRTLDDMINSTSQSRVRSLYLAVRQNVLIIPLNFRSGTSIDESFNSETRGQNIKRMIYRGNRAVLESAIILPEEHFFNGNKIRFDGLLTLLHEYSHIVLPDESRIFAMELLGIDDDMGPDEIDEFFADLVMTRISARLLLPEVCVSR